MTPDACPPARTGQPPPAGRHCPSTRSGLGRSDCWHRRNTERCRRTGNLHTAESGLQHKAAFICTDVIAAIPYAGSPHTARGFMKYPAGVPGIPGPGLQASGPSRRERPFRPALWLRALRPPISLSMSCATIRPQPANWAVPGQVHRGLRMLACAGGFPAGPGCRTLPSVTGDAGTGHLHPR
jgi:hypothetical protein